MTNIYLSHYACLLCWVELALEHEPVTIEEHLRQQHFVERPSMLSKCYQEVWACTQCDRRDTDKGILERHYDVAHLAEH